MALDKEKKIKIDPHYLPPLESASSETLATLCDLLPRHSTPNGQTLYLPLARCIAGYLVDQFANPVPHLRFPQQPVPREFVRVLGAVPFLTSSSGSTFNWQTAYVAQVSYHIDEALHEGFLPVHAAGFVANVEALSACPIHLFSSETNQGFTVLHAVASGAPSEHRLNAAKICMERRAELCEMTTLHGVTVLYMAAEAGHLNLVKYFLEITPGLLSRRTKNNCTPLFGASAQGQLEVVQYFVKECPELLSIHSNEGCSPVYIASQYGHLHVVRYLVSLCPGMLTAPRKGGYIPLHIAASKGHLDLVKFFVEMGVSAQSRAGNGATPLLMAETNSHHEVVDYLKKM